MRNVKILLILTICLGIAFLMSDLASAKPQKFSRNPEQVLQLTNPGTPPGIARDEDDFMTMRYMVSMDGGDSWSEIMGTGETGMYEVTGEGEEADTVQAWGGASYDLGAIVDMENNLHFVVILNAFSEAYNPLGRENGLYDVSANADGSEVTYTLMFPEAANEKFTFTDCGMDAEGNGYAIWVSVVTPEEGDPTVALYAAKTTDGAWGAPVMLVEGLDGTHNYPHMTETVGENFFVIYEKPNEETGLFDHFVVQMAATLEGDPIVYPQPDAASGTYVSYYVTAVDPIAQDVEDGYVYFAIRNEDLSGTDVGNFDGETWTIETVPGAQRYPSVMMWPDAEMGGTPWVFSNIGPANPHKKWCVYDGTGYNGGDWTEPMFVDSVEYVGARDLLYVHTGVVTTEGRLISGCNVWGQFTPEGYQINKSDDMGETWTESQLLWSIFDDGMRGGWITQNHLIAGPDNYVWLAFCGEYGETDFAPPNVDNNTITLSSYMLDNTPWVVSAYIEDALSAVTYADINWTTGDPMDPDAPWDYLEADSSQADDMGYGTYFFTLPSDTMFGEALVSGDEIWFYLWVQDESGNAGVSTESKITVGTGFLNVDQSVVTPATFTMGPNYPNPFNSTTMIPFNLSQATEINLAVYDVNGRLVKTLFDGEMSAGFHQIPWTGDDVSAGIYFSILNAAGQQQINKMTLLK